MQRRLQGLPVQIYRSFSGNANSTVQNVPLKQSDLEKKVKQHKKRLTVGSGGKNSIKTLPSSNVQKILNPNLKVSQRLPNLSSEEK